MKYILAANEKQFRDYCVSQKIKPEDAHYLDCKPETISGVRFAKADLVRIGNYRNNKNWKPEFEELLKAAIIDKEN